LDDKDILVALGEITATQQLQQHALKDLATSCAKMAETLIKQEGHIEYHIKRTDVAEDRLDLHIEESDKRLKLLEKQADLRQGAWKALGKASMMAGAIIAIIEALRVLGLLR